MPKDRDWKQDLASAKSVLRIAQTANMTQAEVRKALAVKRTPEQWATAVELEDRKTLKEIAGILRLVDKGIIKPGEAVKRIQNMV